ncbi:hypothetical protein N0V90_006993 [Kalmusia sp. IMI 367209]|nr:hypothetical protein N0V90_006993 [Kalmusia sp. IMI 367209]
MALCSLRKPRFSRLLSRSLAFFSVTFSIYRFSDRSPSSREVTYLFGPSQHHPIDDLIQNATTTFNTLISKQTTSRTETAYAYRQRRGRHPPPGFDVWYEFASAHNTIVVEDFFDRIYDDLRPFWGISPKQIRLQAKQLPSSVVVRNGKVLTGKGESHRVDEWVDMVQKIQQFLPDLDMPLNLLDEPRVTVPWEDVAHYIATESSSRKLHAVETVVQNFTTIDMNDDTPPDQAALIIKGPYWEQNNDILLPAFSYWQEESDYATGPAHGPPWEQKSTRIMWRGIASGGRNTRKTWTRFHRHRFVALMNASSIRRAEDPHLSSPTFLFEPYTSYLQMNVTDLAGWMDTIADVAFTKLYCFDSARGEDCPHMSSHYKVKKEVPMYKQFKAKYLPDVDGNAFSGRYLAFLRSSSVPIKATLYSEWHDSRLIPWLHFVPMHSSFGDLYGILEYFVGYRTRIGADSGTKVILEGSHDEQARRIAMAGKEWAEKVLRKEDMLVYLLRLLLEYRRVCEDERELLGWVGDLIA